MYVYTKFILNIWYDDMMSLWKFYLGIGPEISGSRSEYENFTYIIFT